MARLSARFLLTDVGEPQYVEVDGRTHYWIRLSVSGAPEDARAVTYELDETFRQPTRESDDRSRDFAVDITSYGDFRVRASFAGGEHAPLRASLATLLAAEHGFDQERSIRWALASIGGQ